MIFEESVMKICALIKKGDDRIGNIPKKKKAKTAVKKTVAKKSKTKKR